MDADETGQTPRGARRRRPRRSAAARREQQRRSSARTVQHPLRGFAAITAHRGGQVAQLPQRLANALQRAPAAVAAAAAPTPSDGPLPDARQPPGEHVVQPSPELLPLPEGLVTVLRVDAPEGAPGFLRVFPEVLLPQQGDQAHRLQDPGFSEGADILSGTNDIIGESGTQPNCPAVARPYVHSQTTPTGQQQVLPGPLHDSGPSVIWDDHAEVSAEAQLRTAVTDAEVSVSLEHSADTGDHSIRDLQGVRTDIDQELHLQPAALTMASPSVTAPAISRELVHHHSTSTPALSIWTESAAFVAFRDSKEAEFGDIDSCRCAWDDLDLDVKAEWIPQSRRRY